LNNRPSNRIGLQKTIYVTDRHNLLEDNEHVFSPLELPPERNLGAARGLIVPIGAIFRGFPKEFEPVISLRAKKSGDASLAAARAVI